MTQTTKPRHRHERSSWVIVGGNAEWCYQCGAWRQLRKTPDGNACEPASDWFKPSGIGGANPAMSEEP